MQKTNKKEAIAFGKWISKMSLLGKLRLKDGDFSFVHGSGVYAFCFDYNAKELYEVFKDENNKTS